MKRILLIVSDDPGSEFSCSFERSLRFLFNEKYDIQKASYDDSYAKYPDILLILDTEPYDSSYTKGVHFLRKYWAELILKKKKESPPVILLSFNTLQELIQSDLRHFVLCSEGVVLTTVPFRLKDIESRISRYVINTKTIKDYLKRSCELKLGGIIEHARSNFIGPYSLLIGARYVDDIDSETYDGVLKNLRNKEAKDEIIIYDAAIRVDIEEGSVKNSDEPHLSDKKQPLSEIVKSKKILIIDDECKTAGWEETLNVILGDDVLKPIGEHEGERRWQSTKDILNDSDVIAEIRPDNHLNKYDLILLDLYLTADDEKKRSGDSSQQTSIYSGLQLLEAIRKKDPTVPVILFTASNKAFNVKAAEEIGIDGYFQKEGRYHSEKEAVRYYREFERLIEKNICQERIALRRIWRGIKSYAKSRTLTFQDVGAKKLLEDTYYVLQGYLRDKQPAYLSASFLLFDEVLKLLLGDAEIMGNYAFDKILEYARGKKRRGEDEDKVKKLHAFIVRQLRNSFAHLPTNVTFEDALFTFYSLLNYIGINVEFEWKDPYPQEMLINEFESVIEAVCNNVCKSQCSSLKGKNIPPVKCKETPQKSIDKAKFLSLEYNLEHKTNRGSNLLKYQAFLKYSFYGLCLKEMEEKIPEVIFPLLKSRLCPIAEELRRLY